MKGSANADGSIYTKMYVGHASVGGNAWDFDGSQVEVLEGGTSGVIMAQNVETILDPVVLSNFDPSKDLIFSAKVVNDSVGALDKAQMLVAQASVNFFYKAATDVAADTAPSG
jgi:hypothetical protein